MRLQDFSAMDGADNTRPWETARYFCSHCRLTFPAGRIAHQKGAYICFDCLQVAAQAARQKKQFYCYFCGSAGGGCSACGYGTDRQP